VRLHVVSATNLTRDEATTRAALLEVHSYDIALDLTDPSGAAGATTFRSRSVIRFSARTPGTDSFVEVSAESVRSATLNGVRLDVPPGPLTRLALPGLAAENVLEVDADCRYMTTGEGLHRFVDPLDGAVYLYSQFETADAQRMYACFDQPDLKATFRFTVTAPVGWQVVSNGAVEHVESTPEGAQRVRFAETARISTYITALVAGPLHVERDHHDGIDLGLFCRASLAEHLDAAELFGLTRQGLDWYHETFGVRYPFGKYDQLFVPEFNAGAMENAGCVTFREDYVFRSKVTDAAYERRAETLLHEMAHMWFGDLVTMRWWNDLWLNESFATAISVLCQSEATRFTGAWTTFADTEKTWAYRQDQLPSTHPISADISDVHAVEVNFDGITYAKGASVLKQLMAYVGREAFVTGLRRYFDAHAYRNTTLEDLLRELALASGRDLQRWSQLWLETAGVNTLRMDLTLDGDVIGTAAVVQTARPDHPTLRQHRLGIGLYDRRGGRLQLRKSLELDVDGARTEVPELSGVTMPDLLLVNDKDLAYAKIRLDERSLATLRSDIGRLDDQLARALCWTAAWDMTRDAEMAPRDYVRLVIAGLPHEARIGSVQTLLRQVEVALTSYADPDWEPQGRAALADALRGLMMDAEPASDHQLAFVRAFASQARDPGSLAYVRGLLDGTEQLAGLQVDTELRWHLLQCLAALGELGEEDIAAEQAKDPTATGQRRAETARALQPDPAVKHAVWERVTADLTVPNAVLESLIAGLWHPSQRDLLRPYTDRYFSAVAGVWESHTTSLAQGIAVGTYPALDVSERAVAAADSFLDREGVPAPLRRLVVEGRAGILRSLRARARDRQAH
jgi:aminopeptidase N